MKHGFEDHEFIGFYIPMVATAPIKKLPPDLRALAVKVWADSIDAYRNAMEAAQTQARKTLEANGIVFHSPPPSELADIRGKMMPLQDAVAKELRITPDLLKQVNGDEALHGS